MSNQSEAFVSALLRCADGVWLTADQVNRIGADLGLSPARCFDFIEEGHRAGRLEINWGGRVMATKTEPRVANGDITFINSNVSNSTVGHGAVGAGAVVVDLTVPLGDLVTVLHGLRALPPGPPAPRRKRGCRVCTPTVPRPLKGSVSVRHVPRGNALRYPRIHLSEHPGYPILTELDPLRERSGRFESHDVLRCVWNTADGLQLLLRYEPLVILRHRSLPRWEHRDAPVA